MSAPIQSDVRTFEQGLLESISEYARTNSFNSAQEVWLVPGYEGVLGEYGPYTAKDTQIDGGEKVVSAITAKDSSGNVLRVVHDVGSGTVNLLNANGTLGAAISGAPTSLTGVVSFTIYNDKILCFNGSATPFQISISAGTATSIGVTQPTVTNATTSDNDAAGFVKGTVKYYISQMSTTTEGALSVAFGEIDASLNQDGQGTQITIDLSHLDLAIANGTITSTDASPATTLTDSGADFVTTSGVQVGMTVRNITDGSMGTVTAVAATVITHSALAGGSDNNWDTSDAYRVDPNYRIYRTYANRQAPNYLSEQRGGGTYIDNIPDDDLGDLPRLHGDPPPAAITAAAVYNDVIYGVAGNTLYWSDPGEEESWWTAADGNSISLDRGDGDVGKALFVEPDGVVIFKRHHILKLLGYSPADYRLIPITPSDQTAPSVGTESINSICGIPGGAFFFYESGFYVYSQGQVQRVSEAVDRLFFFSSVHGDGGNVIVRYDPRFGVVHCGLKFQSPSGKGSAQTLTLAFHVQTRRWLGVGKVVTGLASTFAITALMYDPEQGEFSQFEYDPGGIVQTYWHYWVAPDQDLGLPSDADLLSTGDAQLVLPRFYGQTEFTEKRFLWVEIEALGTATADGTMKVEYSINGSAYATAGTATLSATRAKRRFNIGEFGREMDIKLTMDEGFRIYRAVVGFQEFQSKSV